MMNHVILLNHSPVGSRGWYGFGRADPWGPVWLTTALVSHYPRQPAGLAGRLPSPREAGSCAASGTQALTGSASGHPRCGGGSLTPVNRHSGPHEHMTGHARSAGGWLRRCQQTQWTMFITWRGFSITSSNLQAQHCLVLCHVTRRPLVKYMAKLKEHKLFERKYQWVCEC